tara:strand:+ start:225 stop:530 length:306 start_codon:yes stop_codon:yes gene_type:complete
MFDSIIYFVKEYFAIIFYILIIFNIVIRVIVTKKSKKKKSRKGGGILGDIWYVLLCIITFGWSCGFWYKKQFDGLLNFTPTTTPEKSPSEKEDKSPHHMFF